MTNEELAKAAQSGNRAALEELVTQIQKPIYNLAVRMLWHPADAEDATQEILVKVITHLCDFRGESLLMTWTWRIATNHLLNARKRRAEQHTLSFEEFSDEIDDSLSDTVLVTPNNMEENLLVEEAKIGCMQGMLLCLNREERAAYVLGEIFGVTDKEGAEIFEITPVAYRKRLSRAREAVRNFMQAKCGLANPSNPCRCRKRVQPAIAKGRLDPDHLLFAQKGDDPAVLRGIAEMDELERAAALFRTHPTYQAPDAFRRSLSDLLDSGRVSFLN